MFGLSAGRPAGKQALERGLQNVALCDFPFGAQE
jgi:hypothetical protein